MSERPMMSCREAIEQLWAYIDGELPGSDADRIHDHLEACASCYPHYDFQRAFRVFLKNRDTAKAPPDLRRKIFLRLLEEEAQDRPTTNR